MISTVSPGFNGTLGIKLLNPNTQSLKPKTQKLTFQKRYKLLPMIPDQVEIQNRNYQGW